MKPTICILALASCTAAVSCSSSDGTGGVASPGSGGARASSASAGDGAPGGASPGDSSTPSATCDAPEPFALPSTGTVVGSGTADSCTEAALRAAVSAGGHITFACGDAPVTLRVTQALQVTHASVIDGAGQITLDGGATSQIFVVASNQSLSVRNLELVNGLAPSTMEASGIGGAVAGNWRSKVEVLGCSFKNNVATRGGGAVAVWSGSSLVVSNSTFIGNHSWYGGALYSLLSPLTVVNSVFTDNETTTDSDGNLGDGGAIGTDGASESPDDGTGGAVVLCGVRISNNQGTGNGGGAYLWVYPPDEVTVDRVTAEGNTAKTHTDGSGALGGAMRISNGTIFVKDSSFLSNTSQNDGGGLYLDCNPTCRISNSTFYGNTTTAYGGAIFGDGYEVDNATFAKNSAGQHGGALFGKDFVLDNSVFVDNQAGNPWKQAMSCSSTGTGAHVVQWLSSSSSAGTDPCIPSVVAADPELAAPADNGGPTSTMLPAEGSPVRGAGSGCETTDQRGQGRDTGACDLGAVEIP